MRNRLINNGVRKCRIVIVAPNDSEQVSRILLLAGKDAEEVHLFPSAEGALQQMTLGEPPHLIIVELQKSGGEGRRLCKLLRSQKYSTLNHVPVLAVSIDCAGMDAHSISSGLGASDSIEIPFRSNAFRAKVRHLLNATPSAVPSDYSPSSGEPVFLNKPSQKMAQIKGDESSQVVYREAFEASGEAMLIFDESTGMIVAANEAATRLYRSTVDEMRTMRFGELAATEIGTYQESEKGGNLMHAWHRRKSGGGFAAEIVVRPFKAGNDHLNVAVVRDLGDRMGTQNGKQQAAVQLEINQAKKHARRGLLHICANCKKIRDGQEGWVALELYLNHHNGIRFSHGICPDCVRKLYPDHDK